MKESSSTSLRRGIGCQHNACPALHEQLSLIPHVQEHRRVARFADISIDDCSGGHNCFASEGRLVVSLTQEMRKDKWSQKGILEGYGTEQNAEENQNFREGDNFHRGVVVGFDPGLEPLGKWMGLRWSSGSAGWARWEKLRHQSRAGEGQGVEQRKDHVGQESDRNGFRSPPEESEQKVLNVFVEERTTGIGHIGLRSPQSLLAYDSIADQRASKAGFVPPRRDSFESDPSEEISQGCEKQQEVARSPKIVLSGCHPRLLQWVRVEIDDTRMQG